LPRAWYLTTESKRSMASASISSSHPGSPPNFVVKNSLNRRLRKIEPQRPPVPPAASLTLRMGWSAVIVYEIKSTVPPPASQRTKLSPMLRPCGSRPWSAQMAAASYSKVISVEFLVVTIRYLLAQTPAISPTSTSDLPFGKLSTSSPWQPRTR
jgi:hypothetical protein